MPQDECNGCDSYMTKWIVFKLPTATMCGRSVDHKYRLLFIVVRFGYLATPGHASLMGGQEEQRAGKRE
jgi:hypothetical protein